MFAAAAPGSAAFGITASPCIERGAVQRRHGPRGAQPVIAVAAAYRKRDHLLIFRVMKKTFKVGDHVSWNSEAGRVRGTIVKVHRKDVNFKGYIHHASPDAPQFEIKSDRTDHIALHKAGPLRRLRRS